MLDNDPPSICASDHSRLSVRDFLTLACIALSLGLSGYKAIVAPITFDEAYTYLRFARQPVDDILSDYSFPNNHILHTLLVKVSYSSFGDACWALRLPGWLGGVLFLGGMFAVCRRLPSPAKTLVPIATAFLPIVMDYHALARGYSLGAATCIWAIWMALWLDNEVRGRTWRRRFLGVISFGGLLGFAVGCVPTYAIFATAIVASALLARLILRRNITLALLARDSLALLLGAGTIIGITYARIRMKPGQWPWGYDTVAQCNDAFWQRAVDLPAGNADDIANWCLGITVAAALILTYISAKPRRSFATMLMAAVPLFGLLVLTTLEATVASKWPFPRTLLLFAPLFIAPVLTLVSTVQGRAARGVSALCYALIFVFAIRSIYHFDARHFPEWRDNAGVPAAIDAIEIALADHLQDEIKIAHPWPLDVCLEYELARRQHTTWRLVKSDDRDATYRILRAGEKRDPTRTIIHRDQQHGLRVARK